MRIQEIIHNIEVGKGVWALRTLVVLLLLVSLTVWYHVHEFQNFRAPEAMEAAQLARNLSQGEGYTTKCIRPLTIGLLQSRQGFDARLARQAHPDLTNPPLYPAILAGLMAVAPFRFEVMPQFWMYQPEVIIALFNQALFFLTLWLVYRLARRLFDVPVAVVTVLVLLGSDILWRFTVSGLSTNLLMLILTALLSALATAEHGCRDETRPTGWFVRQSVVIGGLIALGALTRYAFAWLLAPVLICSWFWFGKRRLLTLALITATFLVIFGPWIARNYAVSGTPFGVPGFALFQDTLPFPDTRLERSLQPDLAKVEPRDILRKIFTYVGEISQNELPRLGGAGWIGAFFLVSLFLRFRNPGLGRLRAFLIISLVVFVFVQAGGHTHLSQDTLLLNTENLLILLLPGVALFGTALFFVLLDQFDLAIVEMRYLVIVLFLTATSSQFITALLPPRTYPFAYPPYLPPWIQETSSFLTSKELMMSDVPWAVAWYGNRNCVWTTLDATRSFYAINDEQQPIVGLYLTPLTTDARFLSQILQSPDHAWSRFATEVLTRTNLPPQFPLRHARQKYAPDQLFLCDRPRWQAPRTAQ
ncbi:MAG TPA: glycosyltransferase family 39 protein [Verrucomicrobiota bacterium]|nr:glycosyltransferase family 39 protein [Verrucomicrobiota bacterium]HRZ36945.1 glycosyltransferase family 39 protein [Candidatus Paceibacterota bacterium]